MRSQECGAPPSGSAGSKFEVTVTQPAWLGGATLAAVAGTEVSAIRWLQSSRSCVTDSLQGAGAILLRGFAAISVDEFEEIATLVGGERPQPYENRSTPRKSVRGNIFTSTEYPASESIPLHNENSYSAGWPTQILFLCAQPAQRGGETPIADSRRVYATISPGTRALFESKGVMYMRNYGDLGLSWQETFQAERREEVEEYCRRHNMQCEWSTGGGLRTRQILPAVRRHPLSGEFVWFNQAHLFHISSLGSVADDLLQMFGPDGVPRNALFGDGSEIDTRLLQEIRSAYEQHTVPLAWRRNDLLILDNMLWAHGRRPYAGPRRVLVAMTKLIRDRAAE
jgi:alpha-ketoglutarate-dependent taurine dioxygenase